MVSVGGPVVSPARCVRGDERGVACDGVPETLRERWFMPMPHWSRTAAAGLVLVAGCASSGSTPQGEEGAAPGDGPVASDYGTQGRRGARADRLTRADIEAAGTTDIAAIIEARLAGVRVLRRGGDYAVQIRGVSSLTSSSDALVLIDGAQGTLGSVALRDIESIEVLKDAAAAIYGVRGANGVLLIRTRRR